LTLASTLQIKIRPTAFFRRHRDTPDLLVSFFPLGQDTPDGRYLLNPHPGCFLTPKLAFFRFDSRFPSAKTSCPLRRRALQVRPDLPVHLHFPPVRELHLVFLPLSHLARICRIRSCKPFFSFFHASVSTPLAIS